MSNLIIPFVICGVFVGVGISLSVYGVYQNKFPGDLLIVIWRISSLTVVAFTTFASLMISGQAFESEVVPNCTCLSRNLLEAMVSDGTGFERADGSEVVPLGQEQQEVAADGHDQQHQTHQDQVFRNVCHQFSGSAGGKWKPDSQRKAQAWF
jgi:hypothetical protein